MERISWDFEWMCGENNLIIVENENENEKMGFFFRNKMVKLYIAEVNGNYNTIAFILVVQSILPAEMIRRCARMKSELKK